MTMRTVAGWGWSFAAGLALAGCGGDRQAGGPPLSEAPGATGTAAVWTELAPATFDATGGAATDPGGFGAPGGSIAVVTTGALSFGLPFAVPIDVPTPPVDAQSIASLDNDVALTGNALIDGDLAVNGDGMRRVTISGGDLFVSGSVRATHGGGDSSIVLEAPDGTIYVTGTIDAGAGDGGDPNGATVSLTGARVVVTGTLATDGRNGGRGGAILVNADGDVRLLGTVRGRGGSMWAASGARGGTAATVIIDAGGDVQLGGVLDLRGGSANGGSKDGPVAGGPGGHLFIGGTRSPTSVTFGLDVTADGGDGHAGAGAGGTFSLKVGGDFTVAGTVQSRGGSIATDGAGDGGIGGNFQMDIDTPVGNQIYRPGSTIVLDGGGSGGAGIAGGGGHLYARSFDGTVTMSGTLSVRGGAGRDAGGSGGLGGHVNIFSDNNYDGIGGNLTITPEGIIDASGGTGSIGGSARNDGSPNVADFPIYQEMIAVLLNADGVFGRPTDGVIDNQGVVIARGGATGGAGGDVAFHGEGVGHLHDPLSGHVELGGDDTGSDGQFAGL